MREGDRGERDQVDGRDEEKETEQKDEGGRQEREGLG